MAFADLADVRLFYTDEGAGSPVLFVHGWSCDSHDWSWQFDAFTARHRVIAADNRGHGRSSVPADGYRPRVFASDLATLLRRLDAGPAVVIGHSLGGVIASVLAVEHSELVRAVVAVDPAYAVPAARRDVVLGNAETYRSEGGLEAASASHRRMNAPASLPHLAAWHARRVLGTPAHVVAETFAGIYEPDDQIGLDPASSDYLRRRECPVLSVTARPSLADRERTLSTHPKSAAVTWSGAGHWLHQERPEEFNDLVLDWIASLA